MKILTSILNLSLFLSLHCIAAEVSPPLDPVGNWSGILTAGAAKLQLGLKITHVNAGFAGTLDSLGQGVKDIPLSSVQFHKPAVVLNVKRIAAKFNGILSA